MMAEATAVVPEVGRVVRCRAVRCKHTPTSPTSPTSRSTQHQAPGCSARCTLHGFNLYLHPSTLPWHRVELLSAEREPWPFPAQRVVLHACHGCCTGVSTQGSTRQVLTFHTRWFVRSTMLLLLQLVQRCLGVYAYFFNASPCAGAHLAWLHGAVERRADGGGREGAMAGWAGGGREGRASLVCACVLHPASGGRTAGGGREGAATRLYASRCTLHCTQACPVLVACVRGLWNDEQMEVGGTDRAEGDEEGCTTRIYAVASRSHA